VSKQIIFVVVTIQELLTKQTLQKRTVSF